MKDHIVEEIHRIREKMLEECGGDIDKLMDRIKGREAEHPERIISLEELKKRKRKQGPDSEL